MPEQDFFYTIEKEAVAEFKDRGSKFIAYACPIQSVEEFKAKLNDIRKEHPKATHHCFAYRIGIDGNVFRSSDDGEPSGTAGRPILGQLDSKQLTNTLIIVVRYFGGTLLGAPGLINAYRSAASLAIQMTPIVQKPVETKYIIQFDYTQMNDVMMVVKQIGCSVIEQELNLFCRMSVGISRGRLEEALYRLNEIPNLEWKKAV
ncbi:MAG: YigZ family protein [Puia sp.]|nr:YigZ family protein [Puia sp.]